MLRVALTSHPGICIPPENAFYKLLAGRWQNASGLGNEPDVDEFLNNLFEVRRFDAWELDREIEIAFEVMNLEVWTFTPCFTLDSAEKLEMTQFFMSESLRNTSIASERSNDSSIFSSRDLDQHSFYRRVGHDDANAEIREQWQYRSMMDGNMRSGRGMATPRFNNAVASRR